MSRDLLRTIDRGIVHRLDTDTSGPLVVSKTMKAAKVSGDLCYSNLIEFINGIQTTRFRQHTYLNNPFVSFLFENSVLISSVVFLFLLFVPLAKIVQGFEHARKQILLGLLKDR